MTEGVGHHVAIFPLPKFRFIVDRPTDNTQILGTKAWLLAPFYSGNNII